MRDRTSRPKCVAFREARTKLKYAEGRQAGGSRHFRKVQQGGLGIRWGIGCQEAGRAPPQPTIAFPLLIGTDSHRLRLRFPLRFPPTAARYTLSVSCASAPDTRDPNVGRCNTLAGFRNMGVLPSLAFVFGAAYALRAIPYGKGYNSKLHGRNFELEME